MSNGQLTQEDLTDQITFLTNEESEIGAELYFISREDEEQLIRFAELEESLTATMSQQFKREILRLFSGESDFELKHISETDEDRANTIY